MSTRLGLPVDLLGGGCLLFHIMGSPAILELPKLAVALAYQVESF